MTADPTMPAALATGATASPPTTPPTSKAL